MLINKRMQAGGSAVPGMIAEFRLAPDTAERKAVLPAELKHFFNEDRSVARWFQNLSDSMRRWLGNWIAQPRSRGARERRAEQIAELLLTVMDAERELPPILKVAFARDPRAYEGWQQMSPTQRRHSLLSIFHYRSPEARGRRIAKMLEEAAARAGKPLQKQKRREPHSAAPRAEELE